MNDLNHIPCTLFRGGTSKGTFFMKDDLPQNEKERNELLLKIMGSPSLNQIDGIGGGTFVTSKVALISPSNREGVDIDYKFIQVMVDEPIVDDQPTCGNILTAVGLFALEKKLVEIQDGISEVVVFDENTAATIKQQIETPNKTINYRGNFSISGVPGSASPIHLLFRNISGAKTGKYLPTGNVVDIFGGLEATCLDISMPTVFFKASDFGVKGNENMEALNRRQDLISGLLELREEASKKMGLGKAENRVIPKVALLSLPQSGGDINIRYFTPKTCHPSIAVSAGFCLSTGCFIKGTLMNRVYPAKMTGIEESVKIENPSGITPINIHFPDKKIETVEGKVSRTARLLFSGNVYV